LKEQEALEILLKSDEDVTLDFVELENRRAGLGSRRFEQLLRSKIVAH
jgi:hypothetical protein